MSGSGLRTSTVKYVVKFLSVYWLFVLFVSVAIVSFTVIAPHLAVAARTYTISGQVVIGGGTSSQYGKGNVVIELSGPVSKSATTGGSSGSYSFSGLPAGTYNVRVMPPAGYTVIGPAQVTVKLGPSATVNFHLQAIVTKPPPSYTLSPTIMAKVNGVASSVAEPGDTVSFQYAVANKGNVNSTGTDCTTYDNTYDGTYHAIGASIDTTDGSTTTTKVICTNQIFAAESSATLGTYTVPASQVAMNNTVCSSLSVTPGSETKGVYGAAATTESCVIVGAMPYIRIFGGDISAGNAQASANCVPSLDDYSNAGIAAWNEGSGLYNGSGSQLASYALGAIYEFAGAQGAESSANSQPPSGLMFADTDDSPSSNIYGGDLGSDAVPCMNNYYNVPGDATPIASSTIDVGSLTSGAYLYTGTTTLTLSGILSSGANAPHIQLFVPNQNVYIDNSISYGNEWSTFADIPSFELVVNDANIYVSNAATEIDGTYIAQNSYGDGDGVGGQIATCATIDGPEPLSGSLVSNCGNQLVVNGGFVANDIVLERTYGTLSDSSTDNATTLSSSAAEQFNYNPSIWAIQPPPESNRVTFNAVLELPPTL